MMSPVEVAFISSFVKPELRDRYTAMLNGPRRQKILSRLHHHFDFEAKEVVKLKVKSGEESKVGELLQRLSQTDTCHIISTIPDLDGRDMSFSQLLAYGWGWANSSLYVCDPQRVALFCDEYDVYLLNNTRHG